MGLLGDWPLPLGRGPVLCRARTPTLLLLDLSLDLQLETCRRHFPERRSQLGFG